MSSSARSDISVSGSCSASSFSNSPGLTRITSAPAFSAPASAASPKSPQANTSLAPGVLEVEAHLARLQSTFIGTTTPPARRIP